MIILLGEREIIGFLMAYDYKCTVALPGGAVGLSAVFDCDTSWSYSLFDIVEVDI